MRPTCSGSGIAFYLLHTTPSLVCLKDKMPGLRFELGIHEADVAEAVECEFEGLRRLRVGHYRVVYQWQRSELVILVVRIGHRREVYR